MRVVWKYPVPFSSDIQAGEVAGVLMLPAGAKVVHVGIDPADRGRPAIWVERDDSAPETQRHRFIALATGRHVPDNWHHHGTAIHEGQLVWHVYGDRR